MASDSYQETAAVHQRLMQLFERVIDLSADERAAVLDRECAGDDEMRARIEALLHADTAMGGAGFTDAIGAGLDSFVETTEPVKEGMRIGAWRIVETLGRGGMGMVFLGERDDKQFTQKVAIKVVSGLAMSEEILTRFRGERQILAKLEHPYIAHLVDGGETESGMPYLVMEFVEGEPIMQACRRLGLNLRERIDLFLKICEAVQFAHQNLIVHRDLKPANIMVTADGFPKLLDFGIAKILDKRQFEQTLIETQDGQLLFTPDHAAPEQVTGKAVTTATDIYCLGILLYELMTGRRPFDLKNRRPGQLEKIICEQAPTAPSAVAAGLARGDGDTLAGDELTSPPEPAAKLRKTLRGDLDNIVLKALRKEPERRYTSVAEFADDIRKYRQGMPVSARPATFRYRATKFIQRNTLAVGAAAAVFVLLATLAATMTVQAARIEKQRQLAVEQQRIAEQQQAKAEKVASVIVDLVRRQDPKTSRGREFRAVDWLDEWSMSIDDELADQPDVQATLMNVLGVAYTNLASYESAESALSKALESRRAVGNDAEALATNHNDLGDVLNTQARYKEAIAQYEAALEIVERELSTDHPQKSRALAGQGMARLGMRDYDAAEPLIRQAVAIDLEAGRGADDPRLADTLTEFGTILWRRHAFDAAEKQFRRALDIRRLALGNDHPDTTVAVNNLATVLVEQGDLDGALPLFNEALEMNEKVLGSEHPEIAVNLNNLGYILLTLGRFAEAEDAYRRSLALDRAARGAMHPDLAYGMNSLAMALAGQGRLDEAESYYRDALALIAAQDHEHRLEGQVLANYAALKIEQGQHDEALEMATRARDQIATEFPDGHWRRGFADNILGAALVGVGRLDEARPILTDSIAVIAAGMGEDSTYVRDARARLAAVD